MSASEQFVAMLCNPLRGEFGLAVAERDVP